MRPGEIQGILEHDLGRKFGIADGNGQVFNSEVAPQTIPEKVGGFANFRGKSLEPGSRTPCLGSCQQAFQAGKRSRALFCTPSLKVREPYFLWFASATSAF